MKKLLLALIATSAVAGAAQAQTNAPRAYVGVAAATADNQTTDSYKTGGKIYGGYNVDQNWGVEAGYTDFGKENVGVMFGWIMAAHQCGAAAAAFGAGLLHTWLGDYQVPFTGAGLLCLLAAGMVVRIGGGAIRTVRPAPMSEPGAPAAA